MSADEPCCDDEGVLKKQQYKRELHRLQEELVKLQYWVREHGLQACVVFGGRGAVGEGGAIKHITCRLDLRVARVVVLGKPTECEQGQ